MCVCAQFLQQPNGLCIEDFFFSKSDILLPDGLRYWPRASLQMHTWRQRRKLCVCLQRRGWYSTAGVLCLLGMQRDGNPNSSGDILPDWTELRSLIILIHGRIRASRATVRRVWTNNYIINTQINQTKATKRFLVSCVVSIQFVIILVLLIYCMHLNLFAKNWEE